MPDNYYEIKMLRLMVLYLLAGWAVIIFAGQLSLYFSIYGYRSMGHVIDQKSKVTNHRGKVSCQRQLINMNLTMVKMPVRIWVNYKNGWL